jgi:F-type H+-transporting ATPase subunit a
MPILSTLPILANAGLPMSAPVLFTVFGIPVTNSMAVGLFVTLALIYFAQKATSDVQRIPAGLQNFWEWLIESLGGILESILGRDLMKHTFPFFATIFIFILANNLLALIPGVGTVGWKALDAHGDESLIPFLRGANADVTVTLSMAIAFFILWIFWSFKFNGVVGFIHHIFGSKAKLTGALGLLVAVVFFLVGLIEVVSILVRPISLTFRLYGNIYGGEAMITTLKHMFGLWASLVLIPVYLFELLVAFVQSLVFCLLTAVFTALMCKHEEGHGEGAHH